jgi:hypothetical protein
MARRTATSYRRTTTTTTEGETPVARESKSTTVVVEDKGLGLAEALILATTVMLLAAIVLTDAYLGKRYGAGIFFK